MKSCFPSTTCPTDEVLSEFADNPVDQGIAIHLEECIHCRQKVDAYIQIQHLLKSNAEPAADLTDRILSRIHQEPAIPRIFSGWTVWLRYAAVIAVTAVLTAFFLQITEESSPSKVTAAADHGDVKPAVAAAADSSRPSAVHSVATGPLQNVSTDAANSSGPAANRKFLPGNQVIHVWSAPDIQAAEALIKNLPGRRYLNKAQKGTILTAEFTISDQTLQKLVDRLYQSGWELFSPLYPQPGASDRTILTGRKIIYQIKIIPQQ